MKLRINFFLPVLLALSFFFAVPADAATGFVSSPIVLTPESPKEGENVKMSVFFYNAEKEAISGTILFYDGDLLIASKAISILPGSIGTASTTFSITAGEHRFSASMKTPSAVLRSGQMEVLPLSASTVELAPLVVKKSISLTAQAGAQANTSAETPILNQIDKAEDAVLAALPSGVKETIGEVAKNLDGWRTERATAFTDDRDEAKTQLDTKESDTGSEVNKSVLPSSGTKPAQTTGKTTAGTAVASDAPESSGDPLTYVKFVFFGILAFIFATPVVFYALGIILIYLIIRFIVRKIRNRRG